MRRNQLFPAWSVAKGAAVKSGAAKAPKNRKPFAPLLMKNSLSFLVAAACGLLVSDALGETSETPAPPAGQASAAQSEASEKTAPASDDRDSAEAAKEAHIRPASAPVAMKTPPPALRPETKPTAPAQGLVWVPGHWVAVKGEWHWTAGVWSVPATPISVWIEARYDAKTNEWTPGYWQPDREQPYDTEAPLVDQSNRVKF